MSDMSDDRYLSELTDFAVNSIKEASKKGDFAFFLLANPDVYGHVFGENGERYIEEFVRADEVLGKITKALPPDTAIIVMADHGFDEGLNTHYNAPDAWGWTNLPIHDSYAFGPKETRHHAYANMRDIGTTILEWYGIDWQKETPQLRGKSLLEKSAE